MFGSVLLATALLTTVPGQAEGLKLTNIRNTYGELGGTRPDGKFLPGDIFYVGFDIDNITINAEGQVEYEMTMEVLDKNNKSTFKPEPVKRTDLAPFGGSKLPARAYMVVDLDQAPGTYTLKLTVKDLKAKTGGTQTFTKEFEVLKKDFGIVGVSMSVNERGDIPAPTTGIVGQFFFVQFGVVTFERKGGDPKLKTAPQPDLDFEMTVLDSTGKPTLAKPISYKLASEVKEADQVLVMKFPLPLTRAGKYTIRLKATDKHSKKTSTVDVPLAVLESAN